MTRYEVDPERSEVRIDATSTVHPIHHRAVGLTGFLDVAPRDDGSVDPTAAVAAELVLPVDRLVGGNPLETRELRRRIDARRYPTITGRLAGLRATAEPDVLLARGTVTFRGVDRPAEDTIRITAIDGGALRVEGTHEFDVRDFGMEPPRILMLRVEPQVRVHLCVVVVPPA